MADDMNRDIQLRDIATGEVRSVRTTSGGMLKAIRTVGSWLKGGLIEADEPFLTFTWFYLAARHAGLPGTESDAVTLEAIEDFFELWDVVADDEEAQPRGDAPFAIGTTSQAS